MTGLWAEFMEETARHKISPSGMNCDWLTGDMLIGETSPAQCGDKIQQFKKTETTITLILHGGGVRTTFQCMLAYWGIVFQYQVPCNASTKNIWLRLLYLGMYLSIQMQIPFLICVTN